MSKSIWKVKVGVPRTRMTFLLVCVVIFSVVLGLKCVYIQGIDLAGNAGQALIPDTRLIPANRGVITDRNGQIIAESLPAVNIIADPTIVATNGWIEDSMSHADRLRAQAGPGIIAGILTAFLGDDFQTYYNKLIDTTRSGEDVKYVVLKRTVLTHTDRLIRDQLDRLGYVGLFREQAPVRQYPNGSLAANVVGYMTYSDELLQQDKHPWTGGDGLEYALNSSLAGIDGQEVYESSPYGRIPTGTSVVREPSEGVSYQLSLDLGMQYMQDQRLAAAVEQTGSRFGMAITMNVRTGEILAMSNYPSFDPNDIDAVEKTNLGNRAVRNAYEPGSVQKVLTLAAVVDQGLLEVNTRVIVPGSISSGDSTITDSWGHDTVHLTGAGVMARSSNIGTVLLTRQMKKSVLVSYLKQFGLGEPTGIGLPGEATGFLPDASMTNMTRDNIAFGQGLSVTAIQEAAAVAAVANGGVYISPTIITAATDADGKPVPVLEQTTRQVVSEQTSKTILRMMESVIAYNGMPDKIEGYRLAGKSGTAQVVDPACGCYRGAVSSYIAVAPAEDPHLLTYVVLDHPDNDRSGTTIVSPVVRDILAVALPRYAVPVSTSKAPKTPSEW